MEIDHKELLKKYIMHVVNCEGVDFIDDINNNSGAIFFTESEQEEMNNLQEEIFQ